MTWLARLGAAIAALAFLGDARAERDGPGARLPLATGFTLASLGAENAAEAPGHALPAPLSAEDARAYRRAFAASEDGRFEAAAAAVEGIGAALLDGHLEAVKLLHPTAHRSSYEELVAWLERWADHPQARRIHKLALSRVPEGATPPPEPKVGYLSGAGQEASERRVEPRLQERDAREQEIVARWRAALSQAFSAGDVEAALLAFDDDQAKPLLHDQEIDAAKASLARALLGQDQAEVAQKLAMRAAARSGDALPHLHWIAGLAAWRLGDAQAAVVHFDAERRHEASTQADRARAAFWSARAHLKLRRPERVTRLLDQAARLSDDFYGALARDLLGEPVDFDAASGLDEAAVGLLVRYPGARRALAAMQIGRADIAEREIRALGAGAEPVLAGALVAFARALGLPSAEMRLAQTLDRADLDGLFPVMTFERGGIDIDRALVLAVIRAESGFAGETVSRAGARGLMQVMPETAIDIAEREGWTFAGPAELMRPETNLRFGSAYLDYLTETDLVGDDLIGLAISYNAGMSRLQSWRERFEFEREDPLLFVESLPIAETRRYVKKVLGNLWRYRARLGQDAPSLRALADQETPRYVEQDDQRRELAQN